MTIPPQAHLRRRHLPPEVAEFQPREASRAPEVTNACKDCRWAQKAPRPGSFKCRRWPPVVHQARPGEALFPIVEGDDYCGEFQQ